jgi:hypothetical protein
MAKLAMCAFKNREGTIGCDVRTFEAENVESGRSETASSWPVVLVILLGKDSALDMMASAA